MFFLLLTWGVFVNAQSDGIPRGATTMPYQRYEANQDGMKNGAIFLNATFDQTKTQSEASDQQCVLLAIKNSSIEWKVSKAAEGLTLRFSMPDAPMGGGTQTRLGIYKNGKKIQELPVTSKWAWQYFPAEAAAKKDPSNNPSSGFPRMRFDEVHTTLQASLKIHDRLSIKNELGEQPVIIDYIELEAVPAIILSPSNFLSVTDAPYNAKPNLDEDSWTAFAKCIKDASIQKKGVFIPPGIYLISKTLPLKQNGLTVKGAGIWHTTLNFTDTLPKSVAWEADAEGIVLSDFSMSSATTIRTPSNRALSGSFRKSTVQNLWIDHFSVGAWIGNYFTPKVADGLVLSKLRIRNTYADGVNFARGTCNSVLEYSSIRNNGDDGMASWASDKENVSTANNVFRFNTVENVWRAGGLGIFGGIGHKAHHCLIKDCLEVGIRFNSNFVGFPFSTTESMEVYEMTVIGSGTAADLWRNVRGAVEIEATRYPVNNIHFKNLTILHSQKNAVYFNCRGEYLITDVSFTNLTVRGTGKDGGANVSANPLNNQYKGYAVFISKTAKGAAAISGFAVEDSGNGIQNPDTSPLFQLSIKKMN